MGLETEKLLEALAIPFAESGGPRGARCTPRGRARPGRREGLPGYHDGGVAPRIGKCVRAVASRGWRTQEDREVTSAARFASKCLRACSAIASLNTYSSGRKNS